MTTNTNFSCLLMVVLDLDIVYDKDNSDWDGLR
jgi:hypothetical protein